MRKWLLFLCLLVVAAVAKYKPEVFHFNRLSAGGEDPSDYIRLRLCMYDTGGEVHPNYPYKVCLTGEIVNVGREKYSKVVIGIDYGLRIKLPPHKMPPATVEFGPIEPGESIKVCKQLGELPRGSVNLDGGRIFVQSVEGSGGSRWGR